MSSFSVLFHSKMTLSSIQGHKHKVLKANKTDNQQKRTTTFYPISIQISSLNLQKSANIFVSWKRILNLAVCSTFPLYNPRVWTRWYSCFWAAGILASDPPIKLQGPTVGKWATMIPCRGEQFEVTCNNWTCFGSSQAIWSKLSLHDVLHIWGEGRSPGKL